MCGGQRTGHQVFGEMPCHVEPSHQPMLSFIRIFNSPQMFQARFNSPGAVLVMDKDILPFWSLYTTGEKRLTVYCLHDCPLCALRGEDEPRRALLHLSLRRELRSQYRSNGFLAFSQTDERTRMPTIPLKTQTRVATPKRTSRRSFPVLPAPRESGKTEARCLQPWCSDFHPYGIGNNQDLGPNPYWVLNLS